MGFAMGNKHGVTHGLSNHRLYCVYNDMKSRCYNRNNLRYKDYGGRGIKMCDEWLNGFMAFYVWAKEKHKKGLYFDRINNDGDYSPDNCRFVDSQLNAHNQRLLPDHNTSGFRGVSRHKKNKKWVANISINGKSKHLGCFDSPKLAAIRYDVEAFLLNDGRPMNFIIG